MKNIAVINAISLSPYTLKPIYQGKSAFQFVREYSESLPETDKKIYLVSHDSNSILEKDILVYKKEKKEWNIINLLKSLKEITEGYDNIFYFYADTPYLDSTITNRMYKNHLKYFANYTFSDGYPYGITPEILKPEILPALIQLGNEENKDIEPGSIFNILKRDINSFDVETELSPKDLRMLRVYLSTDCKRNFLIVKGLYEHGIDNAELLVQEIEKNQELLRTVPVFYNIQVVEGCPQNCSYCPYPQLRKPETGKQGEMPLEDFEKIIHQIKQLSEHAVISISLWGEPSYHSRIEKIVQNVLQSEGLSLIIETSGIGWKNETLSQIRKHNPASPAWIISLDASRKDIYDLVRGQGMEEALSFIETVSDYFPGKVYVQAVRMKDNEEDLEMLYKNWKNRKQELIIQKYDHFCHKLPDKRVTDLSPVKRMPCWHIKRDMNILLNGDVPLCREDLDKKFLLGNIFKQDLKEIWMSGFKIYQSHLEDNYNELCAGCDEYYTYNF